MKTLLPADECQIRTVVGPSCTLPLKTNITAETSPMKTVIQYGGASSTITHIALHQMPEAPEDGQSYARQNKQWVPIVTNPDQGGTAVRFRTDSQPLSANEGDLWYNTLTLQLKVYNNGAWRPTAPDGGYF